MSCFEPLQGEELGPDAVRICHLTDFHLPLPRPIRPWHLANKRLLGYLNLRFGRAPTHKLEPFRALLADAAGEGADLTAITGDLANLSLDFEYDAVDGMLREAGLAPDRTLVIPGNHDRYTPLSQIGDAFERGMAAWLPSGFSRRPAGYPFAVTVGPVEVIALDTAVWRGPIRAAGRVRQDQLERLSTMLEQTAIAGRWPVIAMHHAPFRLEDEPLKHYRTGLAGYEGFVEILRGHRATVLHGHLHQLTRRAVEGLDVIGLPSASNDCGSSSEQLAYGVYTFDRNGLVEAELVRHWPTADGAPRIERTALDEPEGARP